MSRIPEVASGAPDRKGLSEQFLAYAHDISLSRFALVNNNERIEHREAAQMETMNNALGHGILQFELNGPARSIVMGSKLQRREEAESDCVSATSSARRSREPRSYVKRREASTSTSSPRRQWVFMSGATFSRPRLHPLSSLSSRDPCCRRCPSHVRESGPSTV